MNNPNQARPQKVGMAIKLLYAMVVLGILMTVVVAPEILSNVHTDSGQPPVESSTVAIVFTVLMVLIYGFNCFLIFKTGQGRNWARITLFVLFVVYMLIYIPALVQRLEAATASALLGLTINIGQAVALVLLFQKPSSEWFNEMKNVIK